MYVNRIVAMDHKKIGVPPNFSTTLFDRNKTRSGFTLLFDESFEPLTCLNQFLRSHCADCRVRTQKAYAEDLAQWWIYLRRNEIAWDEVDLEQIDAYSAGLSNSLSSRTGLKRAPSTVSRRVGTVEAFYHWAFIEGLIPERVIHMIPEPNDQGPSTHNLFRKRRPGRARVPKPEKKDEHVHPFRMRELLKVFDRLGPNPFKPVAERGEGSIRNRLVAETAFYTGMRIEEVCALTTDQLDYVGCFLNAEDPYGVAELELVVTKGGKKRTVYIHHTLWQALDDYVGGEREAAMEKARKAAKKRGVRLEETDALFVNGVEANKRDVGQAVSTDTIGRAFTRAVVKCGLAKTVHPYVVDPATGEPRVDDISGHAKRGERSKARHSFHDLRHTFAVMFYRSEIEAKRPPPLKKLQQILGHTLLSTTTDIYLKHCDLDEVELSKAFSKLLRNLHDAAA